MPPNKKKILKKKPAYTRWDSRLKKYVYVPPHTQHYYTKVKKYKEISKKEKQLEDYTLEDLNAMSLEELYTLGEHYDLREIRSFDDKDKVIEIIHIKGKKFGLLHTLTASQLREIVKYYGIYEDLPRKTNQDVMNAITNHLTVDGCEEWIVMKQKVSDLTNNEKYVIRLLNEDHRNFSAKQLQQLVGYDTIKSLQKKNFIHQHQWDQDLYYKTRFAEMIYLINKDLFEHLKTPRYPVMEVALDDSLMKSTKGLASGSKEYSIGIDFERELKQPQQILGIQGGKEFTFHLGNDFEMFGHTHPSRSSPIPSKKDLLNLQIGRPEFLVAGKTGETIIMEIGNENIYRDWKRTPVYYPYNYDLDTEEGRMKFYKEYGIKITPYTKGMKIRVFDDPHLEKSFPFFTGDLLERLQKSEGTAKKYEEIYEKK